MIEWFTKVLCSKYSGMLDSSTVANSYVWLTSHFNEVITYANCNPSYFGTI